MSATSTVSSQTVAEWVRIFPRQVTETYTSSVTFMKQLTAVAVSMIMYKKNIFPVESYNLEYFGGVKLRILKKKCRDEHAQFLSTALTQAFEAFDKKYLHQLALCFYDGECDAANLIEYHIFEFKYNSNGATLSVHSKNRNAKHFSKYHFDNIKKRIMHLITSCIDNITMENQNELPSSYDVSLRLYYNEDAPEGYQAPGFQSAPPAEDHLAPTAGDATKLGSVETPFHRVVAHTYHRYNFTSSHEANASLNPPMMTQIEDEGEELRHGQEAESGAGGAARVRCACRKYDGADGSLALLVCQYCNTMQHATCFGVRSRDAGLVARHCCTACSDAEPRLAPSDPRLAALSDMEREAMCLFRRTLEWCLQAPGVCARMLADKFGLSLGNVAKLMKLLHSHGITEPIDDSDLITPRKIIRKQVNVVMSKFFQTEELNLADRLLAQTLDHSVGSAADPVGQMLGPTEKVSLQNATAMGKIIGHTPPERVLEDPTLKQYRDAILSSGKEEEQDLPLSGTHNPVKDMEYIGKKTIKRKIDQETRQLRSRVKTKRAKANA